MTTQHWNRVKVIFYRASELAGQERARFLDEACGEDAGVRREVEDLLSEETRDDDFLESPATPVLSGNGAPKSAPRNVRVLGEYELLEEVGQGAMGIVYRARQESLGREVAVKVMQTNLTLSPKAVERFRLEATATARLRHPNIVPVHSVGEQDGVHYFAMGFVQGESLHEILEDLRRRTALGGDDADYRGLPGRFEESYSAGTARLIAQVADALQFSHEHDVVHRDVKPRNILLDEDGCPQLVDFGLAKDLNLESLIHSGSMVGTPYYMSPEQANARRIKVDHRTDIFSLGVVMYEMLTLKRPFEGDSHQEVFEKIRLVDPQPVRKIDPRIAKDLETICAKALEKDRDRRYATAGELARDLRRFLDHESILARPPSVRERAQRFVVRHRTAVAAGTLGAVAIFAGAFGASVMSAERRLESAFAPLRALSEKDDLSTTPLGELVLTRRSIAELLGGSEDLDGDNLLLLRSLDARIVAVGEEARRRGEEALVAFQERPPWELSASFADGVHQLTRAAVLLPEEEEIQALGDSAASWYTLVAFRSNRAGSVVYKQALDLETGVPGPRERLGTTPLDDVPLAPGYYRITVELEGVGYGERAILVDSLLDSRQVDVHVVPTDEVRSDMVLIQGGPFLFGGSDPYVPARELELRPFWIDRYEVSNADYKSFVDDTGHPAPELWPEPYDHAWDELPVTGVTVFDAEAYAAWAGKRLPTVAEWERAGRGTTGRDAPWEASLGDAAGFANVGHRPEPLDLTEPDREVILTHLRGSYVDFVRPVTDLPEGATPEGVLNLMGNAEEWTETVYTAQLEDGSRVPSIGSRFAKGGSYLGSARPLHANSPVPVIVGDRTIGFRCAKSVWP